MDTIISATARFLGLPLPARAAAIAVAVVVVLVLVRFGVARLNEPRGLVVGAVAVLVLGTGLYGHYRVYRYLLYRLGTHLPTVELLEPRDGETLETTVRLRAHATDRPGTRGPIAAVRRLEFWLYHPSFAEQHAGNHESKVLLAVVDGPTTDDLYSATWACENPYTPARDGDHGSAPGIRTYDLPQDGRGYSVQAHALDDEWLAKPGMPGKSKRVPIDFQPCG